MDTSLRSAATPPSSMSVSQPSESMDTPACPATTSFSPTQAESGAQFSPVSNHPRLFIAGVPVQFWAVEGLAGPCLSSSFLDRNGMDSVGAACSHSLTYTSICGYNMDVLAFAIVEDCPVDVLLPRSWFEQHALALGVKEQDDDRRHIIEKTPTLNVHINFVLKDYVIPETVIHDTVPSHVGTQAGCSSVPMTTLPQLHGYQYLKAFFYGNRFAGSSIYVFESDTPLIFDLLHAHGLQSHHELTLRENRNKLLQHILHGDCFRDPEDDVHRSSLATPYGCSLVTKSHQSAQDIRQSCQRVLAQSHATQVSCEDLISVSESIGLMGPFHGPKNLRQRLLIGIARHIEICNAHSSHRLAIQRHFDPLNDLFHGFERLTKGALLAVLERHAIPIPPVRANSSRPMLTRLILQHIGDGSCLRNRTRIACDEIADSVAPGISFEDANTIIQQIYLFKSLKHALNKRSLLVMLDIHKIDHDRSDSYSGLKRSLQKHINSLKSELARQDRSRAVQEAERHRQDEIENWPSAIPLTLKNRLVDMFHTETSSAALKSSPCASCSSNHRTLALHHVSQHEIDLRPLCRPDVSVDVEVAKRDISWLNGVGPDLLLPSHPAFPATTIINPDGVSLNASGNFYDVALCDSCYNALKRSQLPPLALANHLVLGDVPRELQGLNSVEETMIARCRAKSWIVQLNFDDKDDRNEARQPVSLPSTQRGLKGHVIIHPQDPTPLLELLPPSVEDTCTPICVILVGSKIPSKEWLREAATPLVVRREKVRAALCWLIANNPFYKNVRLDHAALDTYPENDIIPVHIEIMNPVKDTEDSLTGSYDPNTRHSND